MFIAKQKKKENICEYLLYMYQIEDLIRSCNFDMKTIEKSIIERYQCDENDRAIIREWYKKLVELMGKQKVKETGHLFQLREIVTELTYLHYM